MKSVPTLIAFLLLAISAPANAVIIGNKDWRQVTDTTEYSWDDFDAVFDTATGAYDGGGALLGGAGGIDVSDYTWASNSEVNDLFISYLGGSGLVSLTVQNEKNAGGKTKWSVSIEKPQLPGPAASYA